MRHTISQVIHPLASRDQPCLERLPLALQKERDFQKEREEQPGLPGGGHLRARRERPGEGTGHMETHTFHYKWGS